MRNFIAVCSLLYILPTDYSIYQGNQMHGQSAVYSTVVLKANLLSTAWWSNSLHRFYFNPLPHKPKYEQLWWKKAFENIVGKEENVGDQYFLLFAKYFSYTINNRSYLFIYLYNLHYLFIYLYNLQKLPIVMVESNQFLFGKVLRQILLF